MTFTCRAILTILQIQSAEEDPITRTAALLSLVCALISLLYGCVYITRFGTLRRMYQAVMWAMVCVYVSIVDS